MLWRDIIDAPNYPTHIVAVSALITNMEGDVLMIRSPRRGWEPPGGQVEVGETLIEALIREIQEETGITAEISDLVGVYSNLKAPSKVIFGFLGEYVDGDLTPSHESPEVVWMSPDDVLQRVTHPAVKMRLEDALEFVGQVVYRAYTPDPFTVHMSWDR
ncbi:MAG: NUDIX hydrolase [Aggregatilineales bacterium]